MDSLIAFLAKYLIFIMALACLVLWFKHEDKEKRQFAVAVIISVVLAIILAKLASKLYFHHRPFVSKGIQPLVSHNDDNGFPSDHTTVAMAAATAVYFYRRKAGIVLMFLALLLGVSRVAAHVHWPADIIGGLVIGTISAWLGFIIAKKYVPKAAPTQ